MSNFTSELVLEYLPEKNLWKTRRELVYFVGDDDSDDKITVPVGFITDLASVPWPFSMIIPKSGKGNAAAVLHDFLYHKQERKRKQCDLIFLEAMKVLGVSLWKRKVMYRAVRIFGFIPWNNHSFKNETKNSSCK